MARSIIVSHQGKPSTFGYSRVSRKQLYGARKRMPLDAKGEPCQRAELSDDGSMLIISGMTGQGYFDEGGRWVTNEELVGLDASGKAVPELPSTLDAPQALQEVEPEALFDSTASAVYALDAESLDAALRKDLDAGKLFRFDFNARAGYQMDSAVLLANEHGTFAIVGSKLQVPWSELEKPEVDIDDDDGSDDDDLDFEMF
ncbi:hypothetical protein [Paraliomyxa miuraensis]|uniref:hypothetical protein n=1 Tax=Paraliomyxa miuraensis TaxID=376150 RepID=UPI002258A03B|nr:hypothetical protein [Paraliomyxa miuraensis]MCX4244264.1 hypothetical protein [Paraliomyxa miuraensis]